MTDATVRLISVVSAARGGPWRDTPGLTEDAVSEWLGVQEDRGDKLRNKVIKKQEEFARIEEGGKMSSLAPPERGKVWARP